MSSLTAAGTASEQFRARATEVKEDLKAMGALAPEVAHEKFAELRESTAQCMERTKERAQEAKGSVEDFIRERPIQTVLIAAGAGMLIGYLLKQNRH